MTITPIVRKPLHNSVFNMLRILRFYPQKMFSGHLGVILKQWLSRASQKTNGYVALIVITSWINVI